MGRDGTKSRFVGIGYLTPLHPPPPSLSSILLSSDGDGRGGRMMMSGRRVWNGGVEGKALADMSCVYIEWPSGRSSFVHPSLDVVLLNIDLNREYMENG